MTAVKLLCYAKPQSKREFALLFLRMKDQEQGIGRGRSGQSEIQSHGNQLSMSAAESQIDHLEASLPQNLQMLLDEIRRQPPQGPVVHNGERGIGSNW